MMNMNAIDQIEMFYSYTKYEASKKIDIGTITLQFLRSLQ